MPTLRPASANAATAAAEPERNASGMPSSQKTNPPAVPMASDFAVVSMSKAALAIWAGGWDVQELEV